MLIHLAGDVLLQLGLVLVHVQVLQQGVGRFDANLEQTGLAALALEVFQDLVVSRTLLLVLGEHAIDAVDGCIRHEFLEFRGLEQKIADVDVENHVVSAYKVALLVLVVPVLTD